MEELDIPDFQGHIAKWADYLESLRQNWLLNESSLLSFARGRGLTGLGVISGEPGEFLKRGWLAADGVNSEGDPLFHPFRIYPLRRIVEYRNSHSDDSGLVRSAHAWNGTVDLALLLEPLYWPSVKGIYSPDSVLA